MAISAGRNHFEEVFATLDARRRRGDFAGAEFRGFGQGQAHVSISGAYDYRDDGQQGEQDFFHHSKIVLYDITHAATWPT